MDRITAPYGFVPLSEKVLCPEWLRSSDSAPVPPVHDVPFEDGLRGTFELEVEAETPIFVRGTENNGETPFRLGDKYAIPGTSIRGMLRNVVEIISFSRFGRVNDHRYAVRDLHNRELYGKHMAEIVNGQPTPLVNAGWLRKREGEQESACADIEVCDFVKFEYSYLSKFSDMVNVRNFDPGVKQSAKKKYEVWEKSGASLVADLHVKLERPSNVNGRSLLSGYGCFDPKVKKYTRGTIVFTGQPQDWRHGDKRKKHHDFFFLDGNNQAPTLPVAHSVFEDFKFAHSNRGQQNKLGESLTPNEEWGYWKPKFDRGERVPVFFLTNRDGSLRAFGLAMMFRLPYFLSIHDAIKNANEEHLNLEGEIDFAEGVFGTVRHSRKSSDRNSVALKGRIGFSHALASQSELLKPVQTILGGPKASYYPNYVEQDPSHPGSVPGELNGKPIYKTWMDSDARPRGWKRYRPLTKVWSPELPSNVNLDKVGTRFRPLSEGTRFKCHVDIHNLRPQELGAILWAISWGGDTKARHTLGMARPLGYGRCRLSISNWDVQDMGDKDVEQGGLLQDFTTYMNAQIPGWSDSYQMKELLALSTPTAPADAKYQTLKPNEFAEAKGQGLALPSAAGLGRRKGWVRPAKSGSSGANPSGATIESGSAVRGVLSGEQTKSGKELFKLNQSEHVGFLLNENIKPANGFQPGQEYLFIIKASGNPYHQLEWQDPERPQPTKKSKPQGRRGRGGGPRRR